MEDVRGKYVSPAIDQLAFNCPHCGALTKQFWHTVHVVQLQKDRTPLVVTADTIKSRMDRVNNLDPEERQVLVKRAERASGRPHFVQRDGYTNGDVYNVSISRCFNCDDLGIWICLNPLERR
jgi:hypothetical protein